MLEFDINEKVKQRHWDGKYDSSNYSLTEKVGATCLKYNMAEWNEFFYPECF